VGWKGRWSWASLREGFTCSPRMSFVADHSCLMDKCACKNARSSCPSLHIDQVSQLVTSTQGSYNETVRPPPSGSKIIPRKILMLLCRYGFYHARDMHVLNCTFYHVQPEIY
jgi:hypothetical protein